MVHPSLEVGEPPLESVGTHSAAANLVGDEDEGGVLAGEEVELAFCFFQQLKCPENKRFTEGFENTGLDYEYRLKSKSYRVKFFADKDFTDNEKFLKEVIKSVVDRGEMEE